MAHAQYKSHYNDHVNYDAYEDADDTSSVASSSDSERSNAGAMEPARGSRPRKTYKILKPTSMAGLFVSSTSAKGAACRVSNKYSAKNGIKQTVFDRPVQISRVLASGDASKTILGYHVTTEYKPKQYSVTSSGGPRSKITSRYVSKVMILFGLFFVDVAAVVVLA
jgi:hypothetical protein